MVKLPEELQKLQGSYSHLIKAGFDIHIRIEQMSHSEKSSLQHLILAVILCSKITDF